MKLCGLIPNFHIDLWAMYMYRNVGIGNKAAHFHFWEYSFWIFGIVSLQCNTAFVDATQIPSMLWITLKNDDSRLLIYFGNSFVFPWKRSMPKTKIIFVAVKIFLFGMRYRTPKLVTSTAWIWTWQVLVFSTIAIAFVFLN